MLAAATRPCGRLFIVTHGRGQPRGALQSYPPGRAHEPCAPGRARAGEGHRAVRDRALQRGWPVRSTPLPRRSPWGSFRRPATPASNPERPGRCGLPAEERSTGLLKGPARGSAAPPPPRAWEQAPAPLGPAGLRHGFVQGEVGLPSLPLIWLCGFQGEAMFTARNLTGCTRGWESHVHQLRSHPESTRV